MPAKDKIDLVPHKRVLAGLRADIERMIDHWQASPATYHVAPRWTFSAQHLSRLRCDVTSYDRSSRLPSSRSCRECLASLPSELLRQPRYSRKSATTPLCSAGTSLSAWKRMRSSTSGPKIGTGREHGGSDSIHRKCNRTFFRDGHDSYNYRWISRRQSYKRRRGQRQHYGK